MKTKVNRVLTFLLVAAMILGSIHLVAADNTPQDTSAPLGNVPDLTLTRGQKEYDLTAGIEYDKSKYENLQIVNEEAFTTDVVGEFTVEFTLTPKAAAAEVAGDEGMAEQPTPPQAVPSIKQDAPQEKDDTPPSANSGASKPENNEQKPESGVTNTSSKGNEEASADNQANEQIDAQSLSVGKEAAADDVDALDSSAGKAVAENADNSPSVSAGGEKQDESADGKNESANGNKGESGASSGKADGASNADGSQGGSASSSPSGAQDGETAADDAAVKGGAANLVTFSRTVHVVEKQLLKLDRWPQASELTGDVVELQFIGEAPITVGQTIHVTNGKNISITGRAQLVDGQNPLFNSRRGR